VKNNKKLGKKAKRLFKKVKNKRMTANAIASPKIIFKAGAGISTNKSPQTTPIPIILNMLNIISS
jgi:hypothetical protein